MIEMVNTNFETVDKQQMSTSVASYLRASSRQILNNSTGWSTNSSIFATSERSDPSFDSLANNDSRKGLNYDKTSATRINDSTIDSFFKLKI